MPCDTVRDPNNPVLLAQRKFEVTSAVAVLDKLIMRRKVKVVIGPQGAIAFTGDEWEKNRNRVTDACAYRRIMATGSSLAKAEIARAEQLAGRTVDRRVLAAGTHSHDGGTTWGRD